LRYHA